MDGLGTNLDGYDIGIGCRLHKVLMTLPSFSSLQQS